MTIKSLQSGNPCNPEISPPTYPTPYPKLNTFPYLYVAAKRTSK